MVKYGGGILNHQVDIEGGGGEKGQITPKKVKFEKNLTGEKKMKGGEGPPALFGFLWGAKNHLFSN